MPLYIFIYYLKDINNLIKLAFEQEIPVHGMSSVLCRPDLFIAKRP